MTDRGLAAILGHRSTPRASTGGSSSPRAHDRGTAAIVASRRPRLALQVTTGGWLDDLLGTPNPDPRSGDPWAILAEQLDTVLKGILAKKYALHERYTRTRERVYRNQARFTAAEMAAWEQLYDNWMVFAWQRVPGTSTAWQELQQYEQALVPWETRLDALENAGQGSNALWYGLAALGIAGVGFAVASRRK